MELKNSKLNRITKKVNIGNKDAQGLVESIIEWGMSYTPGFEEKLNNWLEKTSQHKQNYDKK